MAFWGIEVKPGKPVTHSFDKVKRRLRISQATLGIGSVTKKTLVQCNVGEKCPVFLCALLPDKTESCHLDLEFEEPHDVVFSVIGPGSVYLTGYYVSNDRHSVPGSDSETYGEDIANTETEESGYNTEEDKYEDSFINDDEPEVFPSSPVSSDQDIKEMSDKDKMRERKGIHKPRRKRIQVIDSDHNSTSQEIEDEDNFILSVFKSKKTAKTTASELEKKNGMGTMETAGNKADFCTSDCISNEKPDAQMMHSEAEREELPAEMAKFEEGIEPKESWKDLAKGAENQEGNFVNHRDGHVDNKSLEENGNVNYSGNLIPSNEDQSELGRVRKKKSKRKRKEQFEEVKSLGGGSGNQGKAHKEDKAFHVETEIDGNPQDHIQLDKNAQKPTIDGNFIGPVILPPAEVSSENNQNPKRRRKAGARERSVQSDNETCSNVLVEDHFMQPVQEADQINKDLPATAEEYKKPTADEAIDAAAEECQVAKVKKKKKKSRAAESDTNFSTNASVLSENENRSPSKLERNYENGTYQARTLSDGLTILELALGEKDGKVATLGRKVKVFYTAKLKGSRHVFDSNIGKAPYKFRLGDKTVIEGWNVGLQGMRVGEKRRLIVPPSMGYGHQGAGENVPPDSWLVYEVELVSAR